MVQEGSSPRASKRRKMDASSTPSNASLASTSASASNAAAGPSSTDEAASSSHPSAADPNQSPEGSESIASDVRPDADARDAPAEVSADEGQADTTDLPIAAAEHSTQPDAQLDTDGHTREQPTWPASRIPVEIFNLIVALLRREDIQSMRLVNHEFDAKIAEVYFKTVVVPFRPEFEALYGSLNINPTQGGESQKLSLVVKKKLDAPGSAEKAVGNQDQASPGEDSLLSAGHRVFQQFGDKMRKFALALELNEHDLAFPPLKINQEIVPAPWGLYRWPIMSYQRYTQLEGLEQMADETGYMKEAFQFLENVTEIGISCDAGLGWLRGPDTNPLFTPAGPPVFRPVAYNQCLKVTNDTSEASETSSLSLSILKQMVLNAGYAPHEWPKVVLRLLQDEGREGAVVWADKIGPDGHLVQERVPKLKVNEKTSKEAIIQHIESVIERGNEGASISAADIRTMGLVPNSLTLAQAEMLLELEWAHRALMQSYVIAVMDNKDSFKNLKQLTIARCPGCHVVTWSRRSFWETMTSIETFHLGVIPDWREITKDVTGDVTQRRVAPTNACQHVFILLNKFVGRQKNIKNLSFEWICGGEFALGKSQRDRYILPAPVLSDFKKMVDVQSIFQADDVLNIPCVRKLTLKNCWFTPHVFLNFFSHMSMGSLVEIDLESVSLTGPPSTTPETSIYPGAPFKPAHWPWPLCVGAEPGHWFQLQRHNGNAANANQAMPAWFAAMGNAAFPQAPPNGANIGMNVNGAANAALWPPQPLFANPNPNAPFAFNHHALQPLPPNPNPHPNRWRAWSWPHVLARLGLASNAVARHVEGLCEADKDDWNGTKRSEQLFSSQFDKLVEGRHDKSALRVFRFKSCGYALIESPHIDSWKIIPNEPVQVHHSPEFVARLRDLDNQMLFTQDGLLAKILNYMPDREMWHLQHTFGLEFGWEDLYLPVAAQLAAADGNPQPGRARFHGSVHNADSGKIDQEVPSP